MGQQTNQDDPVEYEDHQLSDFNALLKYMNYLGHHKLGYPVSLLTFIGMVDNKILGIEPGSLANVLLNNVGDPFKDSETSRMEVKKHEREIIAILANYFGLKKGEARGYVTTGGTEGNFAGLWWSKRYLINSAIDNLIAADSKTKLLIKEEQQLSAILAKTPLNDYPARADVLQKMLDNKNLIEETKNFVQQLVTPTVFYTKEATHYSIPKISEILKLNTRPIMSHPDGSMDLNNLHKELLLHLGAHPNSAIIVLANVGTTITGAIDDVPGIKKILDSIPSKPTYTIHLDGALTGFVLPVLKPFGDIENYFSTLGVNTIAFSAHKYPGLSQPCGIILARSPFFLKAFEKTERSVEYVGNILDVTITGSRSGLNVLMFYNALITLGLDQGKERLTEVVRENIEITKYLYHELVKVYGAQSVSYPFHFNVGFPKPSAELSRTYQLMLTGERANICVLPNVSKQLIDKFIIELKHEKEQVMSKTTTKAAYAILTLQEMHLQQAVTLFAETFCKNEPITKHLGISAEDYEPFARQVIKKAIRDGLSVIAIDQDNRAIACAIAEDLSDRFEPTLSQYPRLAPIFELMDELDKPFLQGKRFKKGKIAHVWIAAVDKAYQGQGLSTAIDLACSELGVRKGYDFAYAEFTNDLSEKITHHYENYKMFNKISYDEFTYQGTQPFKGVKGGASAYIISMRPGVKLDTLEDCYVVEA